MTAGGSLSTRQAGTLLGVTAPTVRSLLDGGEIVGRKVPRGSRFTWEIEAASVASYLARKPPRIRTDVRSEIRELRAELDAIKHPGDRSRSGGPEVARLRAALVEQRAIVQALRDADDARAQVVEHLLAALAAGERADEARKAALRAAETIVGYQLMPADAGGITH